MLVIIVQKYNDQASFMNIYINYIPISSNLIPSS